MAKVLNSAFYTENHLWLHVYTCSLHTRISDEYKLVLMILFLRKDTQQRHLFLAIFVQTQARIKVKKVWKICLD